ncbi:MAG TPA: phospholipid carrier-dependent glycosyltransferase [Actinomycetota bacterium]|nr:phospholipid carrier-dependent glycosyltransferase [Actinomycetota bacterium]
MSASGSVAVPPSTLERFRRAVNRPAVALVAVGVIAAVLRFTHVTYPEQRIFDEYYYSKSACIFLGWSNERCDVNSEDERYWRSERSDVGAWVHPPLGKWAIAVGELVFGPDPFGWRFSAVIFGSASVVMLAGIAQLLFRKPIWTFTAGLLLATESLHFVQSRLAMLDIFVTAWIVAGFLFLVLDREWIERRTFGAEAVAAVGSVGAGAPGPYSRLAQSAPVSSPTGGGSDGGSGGPSAPTPTDDRARAVPEPLFRPWRIAAGVAFGGAVASKWSGVTAIATAVLLSMMWERSRRKRAGVERAFWGAVAAEGFGIVISLLLVPVAVYVVSYVGWFAQNGLDVRAWLRLQGEILDYHQHLDVLDEKGKPIHPYLSEAWKWIFLVRPILYYSSYPVTGLRKVIYANGNPAVFWGGLIAIPFAVFRWRQRRDWRAGFAAMTVLGLYVPWMLVPRPQFLFYATPIVPFLVLACVYALQDVAEIRVAGSRSRPYLPFVVGFVVLSVGLFIWFWPALTGGPLSDAAFRLRAWFPTWT